MSWIKRKIQELAGVDDLNKRLSDMTEKYNKVVADMEEQVLLHAEDFKFLAKRISLLEDEVFDCSADNKEFGDEEE